MQQAGTQPAPDSLGISEQWRHIRPHFLICKTWVIMSPSLRMSEIVTHQVLCKTPGKQYGLWQKATWNRSSWIHPKPSPMLICCEALGTAITPSEPLSSLGKREFDGLATHVVAERLNTITRCQALCFSQMACLRNLQKTLQGRYGYSPSPTEEETEAQVSKADPSAIDCYIRTTSVGRSPSSQPLSFMVPPRLPQLSTIY